MIRLGVTGTDTGVGKTVIASALVALLRARGLRVAAMKPVETGVVPGAASDAALLRAAAGGEDQPADVCPVSYAEPLAPLVAAARAGRPVDPSVIEAAFARLAAGRDAIIVEGAGGLRVPLTQQVSFAELFARWRLGVVIVAANRLGAINHVLLTVDAARAAQLRIAGVVVNTLSSAAPDLAATTERCGTGPAPPGDARPHMAVAPGCHGRGARRARCAPRTRGPGRRRGARHRTLPHNGTDHMTVTSWNALADASLAGRVLDRDTARAVLTAPDTELLDQLAAAYRVRRHHWGNRVRLHFLLNAQSGLCPEDCNYCSQSKVSTADIEQYPMLAQERILAAAGRAAELKAGTFCLVISGRAPGERVFEKVLDAVREVRAASQSQDLRLPGSVERRSHATPRRGRRRDRESQPQYLGAALRRDLQHSHASPTGWRPCATCRRPASRPARAGSWGWANRTTTSSTWR